MCKTGHNHLWDSRVNLFQNVRLDHDAAAENYAGRVKNMDQGCKTKHDLINPFIYDCFNFRAFQIGENLAAVGKNGSVPASFSSACVMMAPNSPAEKEEPW